MSDPYLDPASHVLRNLGGYAAAAALEAFENEVTQNRTVELAFHPIVGHYDLDHLCAIHRHIFQDVYDWAGELRTVSIQKGGELFALAPHLEVAGDALFKDLAAEHFLHGLDRGDFVRRVAFYLSEINALHPFREGNGRAQRAFLTQLANDAGWPIDWETISEPDNITASIAGHRGDLGPWEQLLNNAVTRPANHKNK